MSSKVIELVKRSPVCVLPNTSVRDAVKLMYKENIGSVLVIDRDGTLVGIFTEKDLVKVVATGTPLETPIDNVMTKEPIAVHPDTTILEVVLMMAERKIRHLPVVDGNRKPIGLVSIRDIIDLM